MLVENLPQMILEEDDTGKTPLDVASEKGTAWFIRLLLTKEPSSYKDSAWIEACNRGHTDAIKVFIDHSPDFKRFCIEAQDSPLHHIKLGNYNRYQEFLTIPFIRWCINMQDRDGSTPLHRALERRDILLAEQLLVTNSVSTYIQDRNGYTAIDLLVELCDNDGEWEEMRKRVGIPNPRKRMNFVPQGAMEGGAGIQAARASSVTEMRGILSVVAALIATITFAAVFALPGGLDQKTGEATLATKASFLAFIVADTYAMCCSMLVLFFLIWSMVITNRDRSTTLIDRSVLILIQSLCGTLVAFITAIFTVISRKSLWASMVVIIMCLLAAVLAVSANTNLLHNILDYLAPPPTIRRRNN